MKFILMTNPTLINNVCEELLKSGLRPEAIVTDNPFFVKRKNFIKYSIKRAIVFLKYIKNTQRAKDTYRPYFLAKEHGIPVYNSNQVNTEEFAKKVKNMGVDYIFTFGFRILKESIINAPKNGCINFHPAYLPFNRGATPSKWVLLNNQNTTGITFHYINKGIDDGEIIEQYRVSLSGYENTEIVNKYLFGLGSTLLIKLIYRIKNGEKIKTTKNSLNLGSYERPFKKGDRVISEKKSFKEIQKIILASVDGYNGAIYIYGNQNYNIINYIEINQTSTKNEFPFLTSDKNILMKTSDNKLILLIIKRN